MVFEHVLDIKVFKDDYTISIYQLATNLVGKIISSICNPLMDQLYNLECSRSL